MDFLDRIDERRRLERFLSQDEGGLACVYGRRRIGKSRLLDEVLAGRRDVVSYCADRSEGALQRARMAEDVARLLPGFADVIYGDWRRFFERWQREAPEGSVFVIDELPYLVEKSPELPSVLQKIADGLRKSRQKMVVCGSSQRMMQGLVLDQSEPLYGRYVARWWGNAINRRAMEIDVVAESADGKTLLVGETKLALSEVEARHALAELKVKAELLPFASRYERVETRLFVAEGGIPDCIDLSWLE